MKLPKFMGFCVMCICVFPAQSFTFPRFNNRRPRTRLFGTSSQFASPRYNTEPRRPSVRPFRIPGFERSRASITSSRASRLGFDLGLSGRALSDPIASMYDSAGGGADGGGGGRLGFLNSVGDLSGMDTLGVGRGGDLLVRDPYISTDSLVSQSGLGFNDRLMTAANSRDLKMLDMNSAESRLRQPLDIGSFGHQMISSSTLGGRGGFGQGQMRNYNLNLDSTGLGGDGAFLLSGSGGHQQNILHNQMPMGSNQKSLGSVNQLGLGSNTLLGIETTDFNGSPRGLGNQIDMGLSGSRNMGLGSNLDNLNVGVGQMNTFGNGQISLDPSQMESSLLGGQISLDSNQIELGPMASSTSNFNTGQLSPGSSTVGLAGNQFTDLTGQQSFLNENNNLGTIGINQNMLDPQLGQNHMNFGGTSNGHLTSIGVQNNLGGGGANSGLTNQISAGFSNNLGLVGAELQGDLMTAALPTQMTMTNGQYLSSNDVQALGIRQQDQLATGTQGAGAAAPLPTGTVAMEEVITAPGTELASRRAGSVGGGQFTFDGNSAASLQLAPIVDTPGLAPPTLIAPQRLSAQVNTGVHSSGSGAADVGGQIGASSFLATQKK